MGRAGMIEALAEFVSSPDSKPPLTVTIEAPWGDGKSSAMMQLRKYLTEKKNAQTVWFNPWRYTEAEALWSGFLAEFTEQMQKGKGLWEKLGIQKRYLEAIRGKLKWLPLVGPLLLAGLLFWLRSWVMSHLPSTDDGWRKWFVGIGTLLAVWGPLVFLGVKLWLAFRKPVRTFVGEIRAYMKKPEYAANRGSSERLHCEFRAWLGACAKPGERIYVFIDDLDRCAGPRAAELLEWLQLMMSNTGNGDDSHFPLVVIAGLAREKVAAAVAMKYREMLPIFAPANLPRAKAEAAIVWGYEYLEKFVDLPVRLPPGSLRALEPYLESLAPGAFEAEKQRAKRNADAAAQRAKSHPKGIRRPAKAADPAEPVVPKPQDPEAPLPQPDVLLEDPMIPYLLRAASGWLNNSPRKLKHFLNLLRLRWAVRKRVPGDKITLEMTARLVLLETARPTLFRVLADDREIRGEIFEMKDEESDGVFAMNGRWSKLPAGRIFKADLEWLKQYGHAVLVADWDDALRNPFDPNESEPRPITLAMLNALIDGTAIGS